MSNPSNLPGNAGSASQPLGPHEAHGTVDLGECRRQFLSRLERDVVDLLQPVRLLQQRLVGGVLVLADPTASPVVTS
jgi:hypothetical protein